MAINICSFKVVPFEGKRERGMRAPATE
jgi:hypothetical protein